MTHLQNKKLPVTSMFDHKISVSKNIIVSIDKNHILQTNTSLTQNSVYSSEKALFHPKRLMKLHKQQPITPTCLLVDLEAYCNDNCSFCTTRKDNGYNNSMLELLKTDKKEKPLNEFRPIGIPSEKSRLSLDMAESLPRMMKDAQIPAIELTGGGEPTLWPAFDSLIDNLVKNDIEIGLVTNGSNISDYRAKLLAKHCTWIRFSMDASNQTLHRQIHRTSNNRFDQRIHNIQKILRLKHDKLVVGISFVITPVNILDIEESCKFYKNLGVDHIRFTWMYDKTGTAGLTAEDIDSTKELLLQYKKKYEDEVFGVLYDDARINLYSKPNDDFSTCYMQRFVWAIAADGKVYPCCIMKYNEKFAIGDINKQSLKEILHDKYSHDKMDNLNPKSCFPCWLRNKNKIIGKAIENDLKNITDNNEDVLHYNFI